MHRHLERPPSPPLRRRASAAWVALGLLSLWGCSDNNLRLEMPRNDDVVSAFPGEDFVLYKEVTPPVTEGLGVTSAEPTGVISQVSAINVSFSKSMVEIDGARDIGPKGPFTISPPLEGSFRWLGPRTASFVPHGAVPMATKFSVTVPETTVALDGSKLDRSFTFSFNTPGLRLVRFDPSWYQARLRPDDKIFLQFNLPVRREQLESAIRVEGALGGASTEIPFKVEETTKDRGEDTLKQGTGFLLTPTGGFQTGYTYTVSISDKLATSEGPLTLGEEWKYTFGTYGPFSLTGVTCYADCPPNYSWSVNFSNPVDPKTIQKCITVTPPVKLENLYGYGTQVTMQPSGAKPGTDYTVKLAANCTDQLGNKLGKTESRAVRVGHYPPYIRLDGGMNFMEVPKAGGDLKYPVTLRNTKETRVQMLRLEYKDLGKFIQHYREWDEQVLQHFKPQVDRKYGTKLTLDESKTYGIDLREVLGGDDTGLVYLSVNSPGSTTGFSWSYDRQAVVQVTDIGLTAKYSPESILVWTTRLSNTDPLEGVSVAMLDAEGKELWQGKTDAAGLATGPGLKTFGASKPRLLVARKGKDLTFTDLESWSMQIMPYRFGLDYEWDAPAAAVRGHVFTERGVYRPGESVNIKGFLRMDRGRRLEVLDAAEATVTIVDAQGEAVSSQTARLSELGSFHLTHPIDSRASLGTWSIQVQPVGLTEPGVEAEARGSFRVEAYRAPDFEVIVSPEARHVSVGESLTANVNAQYLFGAPMSAARVTWSATRRETDFRPAGFEGYDFGDQESWYWWMDRYQESAYIGGDSAQLDPTGALSVKIDLAPTEKPRPEVVTIEAEVTDLNGQVITGRGQANLHPADFYIGLKRPGYLVETKKPFDLNVVAVKPDGTAAAGKAVKVELKRRVWRSVRKKAAGGGYTWVTETEDEVRGSCAVKTTAEGVGCQLDIPASGYYVIEATSTDGHKRKVVSTSSLYAWGGDSYWWGRTDDERVDLIVDKASYGVGDTARVMVKSPFEEARALVTVERRGVIAQWTQPIKGATATIEVPITEELLPNAYVSVVLVRGRVEVPAASKSDVVDPGKPSYKVGYGTLNVDKSAQLLHVSVEPKSPTYAPGETVEAEIVVTDAAGKPASGEVTFMAVDEGVLSLTGYKTPNPLEALYRRQPLAVITTENRMGIVAKVDTADEDGEKGDEGGGGFEGGEATNYRAVFATTAAFMPQVMVGESGHAKVDFKLPDNLTAYRLMAVAASKGNRFGSADTRVQVRKPLMVRPALPRFLSTGDELALRAIVQNVSDASMKVHVAIEADGAVALTGATAMDVEVGPNGLQEVRFPATVGAPGEATIKLRATGSGAKNASDAVSLTLPVKYPAVMRQHSESGVVRGVDQTHRVWRRITLPEGVRSDVGGLDIEMSSTAMNELLPGLHYLIGYPYGCIEQTTGRTLPLVALNELVKDMEVPGVPSGNVKVFAQSGIDRLFSMQTYEGGLGYWPGDSEAHPWGSAYGGLALVRASRMEGLNVDANRLDRLLSYLRDVLHGEASSPPWWADYAMDVVKPLAAYTLAVADVLEPGDLDALYQNRGLMPAFGKALLAMTFVEVGGDRNQIAHLLEEMLIGVEVDGTTAHLPFEGNDWDWMFMNTNVRADAIALMALLAARPEDPLVPKFARGLLEARRGGRWLNTQENAFAVMALAHYFSVTEKAIPNFGALVGIGDQVLGQETFRGRSFAPRRVHIPMQTLIENKGEVLSLVRSGDNGSLHYTLTLNFVEAKAPKSSFDNGFTLMREYLAAEGPNKDKPIEKVKVGDVVKVRLTLVSPTERRYVAVEDPLPAGLEPINTQFETTSVRLGEAVDKANADDDDDWWRWWYPGYSFDHIEQRDDRVLLFANVLNDGVFDHVYLARATTPGTFAAPGARVEEMYSPTVYGRTEASVLVVEP